MRLKGFVVMTKDRQVADLNNRPKIYLAGRSANIIIEQDETFEPVTIICRDSVNYRYKNHYYKRKKAGRCIRCNTKTNINPWRKEPYRYCEKHRLEENEKKLLKRQED